MKMDYLQTSIICGIFSVLGAALYYQWVTSPRNQGKYSTRRKWWTVIAAALISPLCWFIMNELLGLLPTKWASYGLLIGGGLLSFFFKKPTDISAAEQAGVKRIQTGILIGAAIFIAICLFIFRPSLW